MIAERATRDSWQIKPMPALKVGLQLDLLFSTEEYECIRSGFVPKEMEDKWFIYLEGDGVWFHRSWSGVCVYQLRLEAIGEGYRVAEAWANRDPQQYQCSDDDYDVVLLTYLIDRLLLGKDVLFPFPGDLPPQVPRAVYRHHVIGYGRAKDG